MSVKEEDLLEEIAGYLHGYLKAGKIRVNTFFSKINVNISNLEQLLTVRFLLKKETKDFVEKLPMMLKRFKTTTMLRTETNIGIVKGQINWEETTKERLARNYRDRTIFSTSESIRSYNTPENIVLKEILGLLYKILYEDNYIQGFEKATWFSEWSKIKENVAKAYKRNIYLQRVDHTTVSNRAILKVLSHRNELYRNAAKLLLQYCQIVKGEYSEEDIKVLLRETFIAPDNIDVLFELYWAIRLIREETDESQLHLMDGSQSKVASWEKESFLYHLYHDSNGSKEVQFKVHAKEISESNNEYLKQKYRSFTQSNRLIQSFFGSTPNQLYWSGRPDLLLEVYDKYTNKLVKVIIGEVKNTKNKEYAITGLEELVDYMHLIRDKKGNYLMNSSVEVKGLLCIGDVEMIDIPTETNNIRVLQYIPKK